MSIINLNEAYNNFFNEEVLLEKMTKEEYRRRNFKRKYHWEQDPNSKNPNVGFITDSKGNRIRCSIDNFEIDPYDGERNKKIKRKEDGSMKIYQKTVKYKTTNKHHKEGDIKHRAGDYKYGYIEEPGSNSIETVNQDGNNDARYLDYIHFEKDFFKNNKRSHRGQGAKASVDHEIGHYLLHRDPAKYAKNEEEQKELNKWEKEHGNKYQFPISKANQQVNRIRRDDLKNNIPNQSKSEYYPSEDIQKEREKGWNAASKYDKRNITDHANPEEYEADRVAENRNPGSGRYHMKDIKRAYHKQEKENAKKANKIRETEYAEARADGMSKAKAKKIADDARKKKIGHIPDPVYYTNIEKKKMNNTDVKQRTKALADPELRRNSSYKI